MLFDVMRLRYDAQSGTGQFPTFLHGFRPMALPNSLI